IGNREILDFQRDIGTDIGTPLDIPTPPDVPREQAESDWEVTLEHIREAIEYRDHYLLNAPVQGSLYEDLREEGARQVYDLSLDVYPVGAVVPLMQEYRFAEMVDVVAATKKGLGSDAPVHLFGAGHPMVFALAVALGCDLFDSAAYALYAKDGRYLTPEGTKQVSDLKDLPCACETCRNHSLEEIKEDVNLLAQHNLDVSFGEIRRVRQAVSEGNLLELVEQRCHAHPKLLNGLRRLGEHGELLEEYDPTSKSTFFYLGFPKRPEVKRHHDRLERLTLESEVIVTPLKASERSKDDTQILRIEPPFGPFPPDLAHTYPLNAEFPDEPDHEAVGSALEGLLRLARLNPDSRITFENPGWDHALLETVEEKGIEIKDIGE
ncbi:MAG: tRNA guanosine(15) transglycosylase TgtA, partial [Halobacteria archaeon]|nr:tRNA guanosine(15) transglycosylase TgtA [Halobacteria archaeon]